MSVDVNKVDGLRILSLDGGDLNCISQLKILEEFMKRLENDSDAGKAIRPCEYFHSITGVGASGVIAILLGVLGLSVDDASAAFIRFCEEVSLGQDLDPHLRSAKLIAASKVLLQGIGVPEESTLRRDLHRGEGCKVSIPYMSAADMTHCRILRSYESGHSSHNPTIIEAIRIAWANPGLFPPLRTGPQHMQEELVSAVDGCNNPMLQAVEEAHNAFGKDQKVACLLSLGTGKPGNRSVTMESAQLAQMIARDTERTAEQLDRRYSGLQIYFRLSVDRTLELGTASRTIEQRAGRITSYTSTYLETHAISETLDRCVKSSQSARYITMESLYRTRASGSRSSLGLPPLSAFFVPRKKPMSQIVAALSMRNPGSPAIGLVIGLGGTGKTQISLKYAYDHDDEYDHIIFIDASSTESLEKSLIARIRLIDRQLNPSSAGEAVSLLVNPEGTLTTKWLIIMDNADNSNVNLQDFIPSCGHGCVLITSRNAALSDLNPDGYIPVDAMSREEAVEALLSAVLGTKTITTSEDNKPTTAQTRSITRTKEDYECAVKIVEELGCLPLAVIQAACYIKRQKCLHEYPNLLKTSRNEILRWPASVQRDTLKYAHSTYAAFDTTLSVLTPHALELLGIISFFNFSDFPKALIQLAASLQFNYQHYDLLDRPPEYQQTLDLLRRIFCPGGNWSAMRLDSLLEQLQSLSLVSLVPVSTVVTLRFHPLLHGWANDRLSAPDRVLFRSAAIRLLACGTNLDDEYLRPFLMPHVELFLAASDEFHVNDKAALALLLRAKRQHSKAANLWENIHTTVEGVHGERHLRTTRAALQLADAYGDQGDWERMESMEKKIVGIRKETLGEANMETLHAMAHLARTYRLYGKRYDEALELESEVLRVRKELCGPRHREIVEALIDLAATNTRKEDHAQAQLLLTEALEMITTLVGRAHVATVRVMELLAPCYEKNQLMSEAIALGQEVMGLLQKIRGNMHARTLEAMARLAKSYSEQAQYKEAQKLWRDLADAREETLGNHHNQTLDALHFLGTSLYNQQLHADSEEVWRDLVDRRRETLGDQHATTLVSVSWLARSLHEQQRYAEAEVLWRELVVGREATLGKHNSSTASAVYWLALSIHQQARYAEAEVLWEEVTTGRRALLGENHEDTLSSLYWWCLAVGNQNHHATAEILWRELATGNRITFGEQHKNTLQALYFLGHRIFSQERYADAEVTWREAVAGRRATVGEHHEETLTALYWLARSVHEQEHYSEAETLWREVVAGRRATVGDKHEDTLDGLHWLGLALCDMDQDADAEPLLEEVVAGTRALLGNEHTSTLSAIDSLAECLYGQEKYARAEELWNEVVAERRKSLGPQHEDTLNAVGSLADAINGQERYEESENLWREVLTARQAALGPRHKDTLDAVHGLAMQIYDQDRYSEAETMWRELVGGRREVLGDSDKDTLEAGYWLALSIYDQNMYKEAENLLVEMLKGMRETLGERHTDTMETAYWLALSIYDQERYEEAETLWREVMVGSQEELGESHKDTLDILFWLVLAVESQERHAEAEVLWRQLVAGNRITFGDQHDNTLNALYRLGDSVSSQARYAEAETLYKDALAGRRATLGDQHEDTLEVLHSLGRCLYDQERYAECEVLWREQLPVDRSTLGDRHSDTLGTIHWLARSVYAQQRYAEAEILWKEEVAAMRDTLGPEDEETMEAQTWLDKARSAMGAEVVQATPLELEVDSENHQPEETSSERPDKAVLPAVVHDEPDMSTMTTTVAAKGSQRLQRLKTSARRPLGKVIGIVSLFTK